MRITRVICLASCIVVLIVLMACLEIFWVAVMGNI
jgi:divalent metal cation (Fe/Co/Zn/Cd) transporter